MIMERRVFVKSGALALVTMGLSPSFLRRTAFGMELPNVPKGKVLICLFQRGAADALNIVVPHGEKAYYAMRPSIAIPQPSRNAVGGAIDLDGFDFDKIAREDDPMLLPGGLKYGGGMGFAPLCDARAVQLCKAPSLSPKRPDDHLTIEKSSRDTASTIEWLLQSK